MEEKRKYPRRKLGCAALFKGGTQALENVRIRDISRGVYSLNPRILPAMVKLSLSI
jgi:hypothetical protein